ncbi:MAG: hypothetical protein M0R05_05180 [Bacilli bacterium]|nr:hypothetical protein [Bacilli bacterium]MDD4077503.1 hypothetical protein [Bacilli bacterium]MDD4388865.1 hypothetical protein [Bacilli bacterium]
MRYTVLFFSIMFLTVIIIGNVFFEQTDVISFELETDILEGKRLIPKSALLGINDINEIKIIYRISSEKLNLYDYEIIVSKIKIEGKAISFPLFNIGITVYHIETGICYLDITVSLNEAANVIEYNSIKEKTISFILQIKFKR